MSIREKLAPTGSHQSQDTFMGDNAEFSLEFIIVDKAQPLGDEDGS